MTPETLAQLHVRAFAEVGRGWTAEEFRTLLDSPYVFLVGGDSAFALGRVVVDEAELLTLATAPEARRQGLGRATLAAFETQAMARGATSIFLEVAEDNAPALALYRGAGFAEDSRRTGYYDRACGGRVDALILVKRVPA